MVIFAHACGVATALPAIAKAARTLFVRSMMKSICCAVVLVNSNAG